MVKTKYGNFELDDGGRSRHYKGKTGDCVVRALAIATGTDYKEIFKELLDISYEIGHMPNTHEVEKVFLERHGFTKNKTPRNIKGKKISVRAFTTIAPKGRIVARTREHSVAIVNNVARDTWLDERCVNTWFHKVT